MLALLNSKPIVSGILGSATGLVTSAAAFFAAANVFLAFVAGLFGAGTAIFTFLLVRERYREKCEARIRRQRRRLTAQR